LAIQRNETWKKKHKFALKGYYGEEKGLWSAERREKRESKKLRRQGGDVKVARRGGDSLLPGKERLVFGCSENKAEIRWGTPSLFRSAKAQAL